MTVHPLTTERELLSAELAEELKEAAAEIADSRAGDIGGFVVMAWGDIGGVTAKTVRGGARIPDQLLPQMVAEAVRQDILMRNVLNALADAEVGKDGSA
jgi:hypothetical protein